MDKTLNLQKLYFKDTSFVSLMKERIYNILLIASKYDAFMLEEDGRIDELIFNEYTALNLRYPPRFTIASEHKEVKELLQTRHFDLIIAMPTSDNSHILEMANELKVSYADIPIVVLTTLSIIFEIIESLTFSFFTSVLIRCCCFCATAPSTSG